MLKMLENFLVGAPLAPLREHKHCYHASTKPIMMVIPDGHVVQKCCKCESVRTVHGAHT